MSHQAKSSGTSDASPIVDITGTRSEQPDIDVLMSSPCGRVLVVCKLQQTIKQDGRDVRSVIVWPPNADDMAAMSLELRDFNRNAGGEIIQRMSGPRIENWLCRLTGLPAEVLRALPLRDGARLVAALRFQLRLAECQAVKS